MSAAKTDGAPERAVALERTLNGCPVLLSPRLAEAGVPHAFTTRHGGVSPAPYASLNLGLSTGDERERVLANCERVCGALGRPLSAMRVVRQVHGRDVVPAAQADWRSDPFGEAPEADGLFTDDPEQVVGVRAADCLPILLATRDGAATAAVHAGWRGAAADIAAVAVQRLCAARDATPADLLAAIGPGIGGARYEVSEEVAAQFPAASVRRAPGRKPHVDLAHCVAAQLRAAGVEAIDIVSPCTFDDPRFFSHRRDGARTGRHGAYIRPRSD